jgi:hypothetical protein
MVALALLAPWLGGCFGTAGVSTWQYQSGPGYETERVSGGSVQADTEQGLSSEACTSVVRRQVEARGSVSSQETTSCGPN